MIRAWKDEDSLSTLTDEERLALPENPAGDPGHRLGIETRPGLDENDLITVFRFCHSIVLECSASNCG
jgi:mersacidin/lichenicidin family type 2 lantibiotic